MSYLSPLQVSPAPLFCIFESVSGSFWRFIFQTITRRYTPTDQLRISARASMLWPWRNSWRGFMSELSFLLLPFNLFFMSKYCCRWRDGKNYRKINRHYNFNYNFYLAAYLTRWHPRQAPMSPVGVTATVLKSSSNNMNNSLWRSSTIDFHLRFLIMFFKMIF